MRSLMVEDVPKAVELLLLKAKCQCRWLRRIFLESPMHAFVPPVLLRPTWLDSFVNNSHLRPAQRQLGQAEQASASEWCAVVGSDACRHAVLAHGGFANCLHFTEVHPRYSLAADEVAAVGICDRQRIAPCAVAGTEVALEIHTP